jgi:UDP:flavonoid glycosyltransferase YjiC (YdhE family)
MTALARKVQSRGHDVVFISLADVAPFVEAAGLPFVPCSEAAYPAGSLGKLVRRLSELSGEEALHFTVNAMMKCFVDAAHQIHTVSRNASKTEPLRFVIAYTVKQGEPVTVLPV